MLEKAGMKITEDEAKLYDRQVCLSPSKSAGDQNQSIPWSMRLDGPTYVVLCPFIPCNRVLG